MRPFNHINARTLEEASAAMKKEGAVGQAGGGDLLGSMKDDIYHTYPKTVVNLKTIPALKRLRSKTICSRSAPWQGLPISNSIRW
jgi:CO/xanthine dehydrogenase FAD-binding subunit